ncbi:unnamed protein product [Chrysoparadoxa australica]
MSVRSSQLAFIGLGAAAAVSLATLCYFGLAPKRVTKAQGLPPKPAPRAKGKATASGGRPAPTEVTILYGTQTGTSKAFAEALAKDIFALNVAGFVMKPSVRSLADYDADLELEGEKVVILLLSTYTDGTPPPAAKGFPLWLNDMVQDFRVSKTVLSGLKFAVFGLGSKQYDNSVYCTWAKNCNGWLGELGATTLVDIGFGDDSSDIGAQFDDWSTHLIAALCSEYVPAEELSKKEARKARAKGQKQKQRANGAAWEQGNGHANGHTNGGKELETREDLINDRYVNFDLDAAEEEDDKDSVDMEDLGTMIEGAEEDKEKTKNKPGEMITPLQRKSLTKEGYKLIGSHSAVKLCRWTKAQMRGRGGCYKHTFYGITSYRCMEATPSLACASKCTFCWRHHKNPVGRDWRWKVDEPLEIVEQAVKKHQAMIKEMKGVPGIIEERWHEAFTVAHCALSLVGEPIMYPHINTVVGELHRRRISTFLVTNAQFPDRIAQLVPVTQLYVSIDAATKDSLKAIDRPLFKDFWERFLGCLRELKRKGQRTVYRLTLVKGWNMQEVANYAELLRIGQPELIEIKGVTFCGTSDASSLTMQNVPWHEEVCKFAEAIAEASAGEYGLACEHKHSCCVLLAKKDKYFKNRKWYTWINYDRFHELNKRWEEDGTPFSSEEYQAEAPAWAQYGCPEAGFDPIESRHYRPGKGAELREIKYEASSSGCG